MSYILDALRRAEAERERGAVPSVHTQQFPLMPAEDEARRRSIWLPAAVVVLALALAAVLAWNFFAPAPAPVVVASAPPPAPSLAPTIAPLPPPASAATVPAAVATPSPSAVARPASAIVPAPTASTPAATASTDARRPVRKPTPAADPAPTPAPKDDRIYSEAELPDAVRKAAPKLAFGGSSYSSSAASRMVIWNGRVFHEGDTVASGAVLKQIRQKSAVVAFRGYRYEVSF